MKMVHPMRGFYLEPQLAASYYSFTKADFIPVLNDPDNYKRTEFSAAFLLNVGYQIVISNRFALEIYQGIGYSYSMEGHMNHYSHIDFTNEFPLALSSGVRIGLAF